MAVKYYVCEHCGNIVNKVNDSGVPVVCCGEPMKELVPGTTDGAVEKHVPVVTKNKNEIVVKVGEAAHPMMEAHYIQWVTIETTMGMQTKVLKPEMEPVAKFVLAEGEEFVAAYEYCNLHGLWKKEK